MSIQHVLAIKSPFLGSINNTQGKYKERFLVLQKKEMVNGESRDE